MDGRWALPQGTKNQNRKKNMKGCPFFKPFFSQTFAVFLFSGTPQDIGQTRIRTQKMEGGGPPPPWSNFLTTLLTKHNPQKQYELFTSELMYQGNALCKLRKATALLYWLEQVLRQVMPITR